MVSPRVNVFALLTGLSLLVYMNNAVPQACATIATVGTGTTVVDGIGGWNWVTTGFLQLSQNSNGFVTGTMAGYVSSTCSGTDEYYNVQGGMNKFGEFSLALTYTGSDSGCAPTINMSGTVGGAGCTTASGSWSNSRGLSGPLGSMTQGCQIPTGEGSQVFQNWAQSTQTIVSGGTTTTATYDVAVFQMQLAPSSSTYNWAGRTIYETFPQAPVDGCWYPGSAIPKAPSPPTRNVPLGSSGTYADQIGPWTGALQYYRQKSRTPCSYTQSQVMVIDCPNPPANPTYTTITQIIEMGPLQLTVTRGNYPAVSEIVGAPAPALTLPAILFNLLFPPH